MVEVETHRAPLEILGLEDPGLIELSRRQGEARLFVPTRDADLIAHLRALVEHHVLPIRPAASLERRKGPVGPEELHIGGVAHGDARGALVVVARALRLTPILGELGAVEQLDAAQRRLISAVRIVGDLRRPGRTVAGRDEDHAVGAARAVDRRRRCILQDLHRLDVPGVEIPNAPGHRDAVEHVQGIVRRLQRPLSPQADADTVARLVPRRHDVHAGHAALDRFDGVHLGYVMHGIPSHGHDGPGDVAANLRAVTDHDDFLQRDGELLQAEVRARRLPRRHLDRGFQKAVADALRLHPVGSGQHAIERIPAIGTRLGAEPSADHADLGARQGGSGRLVLHDSADRSGGDGGVLGPADLNWREC